MSSEPWSPPTEWLVLLDTNDSRWELDAGEESRLDAAVTAYRQSAGTRDELLSLTFAEGGELRILASLVVSWFLTTPEARRRTLLRQRAAKEEARQQRLEIGGSWDD